MNLNSRRLVALAAGAVLAGATVLLSATAAQALGPGMACVFDAPNAVAGAGHVDWAYEIDNSGNFVYGGTENPNAYTNPVANAVIVGGPNAFYNATGARTTLGAWHKVGSYSQMLTDFHLQQSWWNTWPQASYGTLSHAVSDYTQYKCVDVSNSAVGAANNAVSVVENQGSGGFMYNVTGWNCMNMAYYILSAYNTPNLPNPSSVSNWLPNNWFNAINAATLGVHIQGYQVTGATSPGLAVQSQPGPNHVVGWVQNGTTLQIVCQTNHGAQVDGAVQYGRPFTTWDELIDGNYVYDWYMDTPVVATNGYSPGIDPCVNG
jgi:hypothetical protein